MQTELTLNDLVRFIRDNKRTIILTTMITAVLLAALGFYNSYQTQQSQEMVEETEEQLETNEELREIYNTPSNELTADEEEELREFLQGNAYYFRVYVEHENFTPVDSQVFLKEILLTEEVISSVEEAAGIPFTPSPKQALVVHNEASSGVHTVQIGTGMEENNIQLGQALINVLSEQNLPILNDKTVELLDTQPMEVLEDVSELTVTTMDPVTTGDMIRNSIILAVVGLVIGATLGVMISIVRVLLQKEISVFYSFKRNKEDKVLRLNNFNPKNHDGKNYDALTYTVLQPAVPRRLVLSESELSEKTRSNLDSINTVRNLQHNELILTQDIVSVDWNEPFDEVVIVVVKNETTKKWYEIQRTLLANFNVPVKVVQV